MPYKKNQKINNFTVTKITFIEEIQIELIELKHNILGSQVVKIKNNDKENLFCLSFKTWPEDSKGTAHILEHTVLCGSKKFPVKDPFFSMLKRSLNTFMNAMTGSDFTCYPASSLLEKDFYNLFEVYLDAVFYPKLERLSFLQEGHRLEFSETANPNSKLSYKGVVYNEMKGSMANPDNLIFHKMFEVLLPDLPYAFNSGGEPQDIPKLTYEQLKKFHKKYYHPSRCLFFLYGNLDLEKQLNFIEEKALKNVKKIDLLPNMKKQKRFKKPETIEHSYPISENLPKDGQTIFSFGFLTSPITNQLDIYALTLLDSILMGNDSSYLKYALMQSNLCKQAESIFDAEISEAPYIVVCKGCKTKDKEALLEIIKNTLIRLTEEPIPEEIIEASLHQLEFLRTEISNTYGPYGLTLFFRTLFAKQYNIDPENSLIIHTLFQNLRKNLKKPDFIPTLIKKYFLENPHFVTLISEPDNNFLKKEHQKEEEKLTEIKKNLSSIEIKKILKETLQLKEFQKKLEKTALECLPKLEIKDIPKKEMDIPLNIEKIENYTIFHHDNFTNKIIYTDLIFDLPQLSIEELALLSLFTSLLPELGAGKRNYIENLKYIQSYIGGIGSYLNLNIQLNNYDNFTPSIGIKSKALSRNADKLFTLLKDTVTNPIFTDMPRIKELLLQQYTFLEHSLVNNAMSYAVSLSQSSFSKPSFINNQWHGINYFERLKNLLKDIPKLIEKLNVLKEKVFCINNAHLIISCSKNDYADIKKNNFYDLLNINFKQSPLFVSNFNIEKNNICTKLIPSPVAFITSSYKTINFLHKNTPYLLLASLILENKILHKKIREEGGAYGSGATLSLSYGIFTFNSYRDPNIKNTLKIFKDSIKDLVQDGFSQKDLNEAKLGVIQKIDIPIYAVDKAFIAYSWHKIKKTKELRQKFREKILSATKEDIIQAVKNHLLNQLDDEVSIVFAGKELIEKENFK